MVGSGSIHLINGSENLRILRIRNTADKNPGSEIRKKPIPNPGVNKHRIPDPELGAWRGVAVIFLRNRTDFGWDLAERLERLSIYANVATAWVQSQHPPQANLNTENDKEKRKKPAPKSIQIRIVKLFRAGPEPTFMWNFLK
jgi:hypothetical protein